MIKTVKEIGFYLCEYDVLRHVKTELIEIKIFKKQKDGYYYGQIKGIDIVTVKSKDYYKLIVRCMKSQLIENILKDRIRSIYGDTKTFAEKRGIDPRNIDRTLKPAINRIKAANDVLLDLGLRAIIVNE